jgi:hypothetical protein
LAEALAAPLLVEGRHGLPEAVDGPTIVALELIGYAKVKVCQRVQDDIPPGRGEVEGALGERDGLVVPAPAVEMLRQKDRGLSQPTRVVEDRREILGLTQSREDTPRVAGRKERRPQGEPEIDGLLAGVTRLWQMRQGIERLLEIPHGLTVRRSC